MKYKVLWVPLWMKLTKFMSLAIVVPVTFVFVVRFFKNDMNLAITFEHVSLLELPIFYAGIVAFAAFFSFVIAFFIRCSAVDVSDGVLSGRNYWYFKNSIPVSSIVDLYPFSNNGIEAIVADGGVHGKVYISTHTENVDDLIQYLESESGVKGV